MAMISPQNQTEENLGNCEELGLPWPMLQLAFAFPFGLHKPDSAMNSMFTHYLPTKEVAIELSGYYYKEASWMYVSLYLSSLSLSNRPLGVVPFFRKNS